MCIIQDPLFDYFVSPLRAPKSLIAELPPVYIHVGSVDPLSDDSIAFVERIKHANNAIPVKLHLIQNVSHAYMQVTSLLPEGQQALNLTTQWCNELLQMPTRQPVKVNVQSPDYIPPDTSNVKLHTTECNQKFIDETVGKAYVDTEHNGVGDKQQITSKL